MINEIERESLFRRAIQNTLLILDNVQFLDIYIILTVREGSYNGQYGIQNGLISFAYILDKIVWKGVDVSTSYEAYRVDIR